MMTELVGAGERPATHGPQRRDEDVGWVPLEVKPLHACGGEVDAQPEKLCGGIGVGGAQGSKRAQQLVQRFRTQLLQLPGGHFQIRIVQAQTFRGLAGQVADADLIDLGQAAELFGADAAVPRLDLRNRWAVEVHHLGDLALAQTRQSPRLAKSAGEPKRTLLKWPQREGVKFAGETAKSDVWRASWRLHMWGKSPKCRDYSGDGLEPPYHGRLGGRSGRIRTCDPRVPNAVLYQTEPHSDLEGGL